MSTTTPAPLTAHNGFHLPAIGFGTVDLRGDVGTTAVASALDAGYRLVDTAFNYENEEAVGRALARSEIDRHLQAPRSTPRGAAEQAQHRGEPGPAGGGGDRPVPDPLAQSAV